MKYLKLLLIVLAVCVRGAAQDTLPKGYHITYKLGHASQLSAHLLFNDSFSYHYYLKKGRKDPFKKTNVVSQQNIHHSLFIDKAKNMRYEGSNFQQGDTFLIAEKMIPHDWLYYEQYKDIIGYKCQRATRSSFDGDSIEVWFAKDLPGSVYPYGEGLPGTVLQLTDYRYNQYFLAQKIEFADYRFILPPGKIVTVDEYREIRKQLN